MLCISCFYCQWIVSVLNASGIYRATVCMAANRPAAFESAISEIATAKKNENILHLESRLCANIATREKVDVCLENTYVCVCFCYGDAN